MQEARSGSNYSAWRLQPGIGMRWSIMLPACAIATVAFADVAPTLEPADLGTLLVEHRATQRAIALARLAETHGSEQLRVLGRHITLELGFADRQVVGLARRRGAHVDDAVDAHGRSAENRAVRIAKLDGLAFDRAVLAALAEELQLNADWLEATRYRRRDGELTTLLATLRPMLVRYHAQVDRLGQLLRPPS